MNKSESSYPLKKCRPADKEPEGGVGRKEKRERGKEEKKGRERMSIMLGKQIEGERALSPV